MPHIFPRRFLRTRDILDPSDFNDDIHPVHDLLSGRLDRTNFNAYSLKNKLRNHPDSDPETGASIGACIAEGAYFNTHVSQIESRYGFYSVPGVGSPRNPPNFVKEDGSTFRYATRLTGTNPNSYPSVVPNHGAWSAVKNADLSDSQKLTFTTGQSKIWISAYAQYIWQGFFEEKKPYINGSRRFRGKEDIEAPEPGYSWFGTHGPSALAISERTVLNNTGPSSQWESLPTSGTTNKTSNLETYAEDYAFPLNETWAGPSMTEAERNRPNRNGYHHISKGFKPSLLQFALRVDGKIIEETITGKRLPFEESAHGLEVTDSIRIKEEDETEKEALSIAGWDDFSAVDTVFGQRSLTVTSAYGDSSDSRPGQKLRSSRAVSYGPEVMPVRLGAVVEVQPGEHTIELVVRRLQRKKGKFKASDFVGVFSRRLLAFDLPIRPTRQESAAADAVSMPPGVSWAPAPGFKIPGFKTEDKVDDANLINPREALANKLNAVGKDHIDAGVLSNKYLPSKVVYSKESTIIPTLEIGTYTGEYGSSGDVASSQAIFPGFSYTARLDNVVADHTKGWSSGELGGGFFDSSRAGWMQLQDTALSKLSISSSDLPSGETVLRPHEQIILMMDVELRGIEPLYSEGAQYVKNFGYTDGEKARELWNRYGNSMLAERYLDLFALFAIGYKKDGDWIIGSESVPAMVNSFNWVNRSVMFDAAKLYSLPTRTNSIRGKDIWDMESGWDDMGHPEIFFSGRDHADYPGATLARGGRLFRSNLGVNIPIMQVIENTGSSDLTISEFGGFASTMVPSQWTHGHGPDVPGADLGPRVITAGSAAPGDAVVWSPETVNEQWRSPVGGRYILMGMRVHFGNSKLTAIKVVK